jgi:hypothetical protein
MSKLPISAFSLKSFAERVNYTFYGHMNIKGPILRKSRVGHGQELRPWNDTHV